MASLFDELPCEDCEPINLAPGAVLLPAFALERATVLTARLEEVVAVSPFRRMVTPGGFQMSVEMTNCGPLGWVTDRNRLSVTHAARSAPFWRSSDVRARNRVILYRLSG